MLRSRWLGLLMNSACSYTCTGRVVSKIGLSQRYGLIWESSSSSFVPLRHSLSIPSVVQ